MRLISIVLLIVAFLWGSLPIFDYLIDKNRVNNEAIAVSKAILEKDYSDEVHLYNEYNESLLSSNNKIPDPWKDDNGSGTDVDSQDSNSLILDESVTGDDYGNAIAVVKVDKIGLNMPVYIGTSERVLSKGAGLVDNTSFPMGTINSHSVISGHSNMRHKQYFDRLKELETGDTFSVISPAGELIYKVSNIYTVLPNDISKIKIIEGMDLVTLLTCTDFDGTRHWKRLLVQGERIGTGSESLDDGKNIVEERKDNSILDEKDTSVSSNNETLKEDNSHFIDPSTVFNIKLPYGIQDWMLLGGGISILSILMLVAFVIDTIVSFRKRK